MQRNDEVASRNRIAISPEGQFRIAIAMVQRRYHPRRVMPRFDAIADPGIEEATNDND